jgi:hypothetical protein
LAGQPKYLFVLKPITLILAAGHLSCADFGWTLIFHGRATRHAQHTIGSVGWMPRDRGSFHVLQERP